MYSLWSREGAAVGATHPFYNPLACCQITPRPTLLPAKRFTTLGNWSSIRGIHTFRGELFVQLECSLSRNLTLQSKLKRQLAGFAFFFVLWVIYIFLFLLRQVSKNGKDYWFFFPEVIIAAVDWLARIKKRNWNYKKFYCKLRMFLQYLFNNVFWNCEKRYD